MGYWVSRDGDIINNRDHYEYVKSHPQLFGFTKKEAKTWNPDIRNRVFEEVKKRGWMRVRGERPHRSVELWVLDNNAIFNLKLFLIETKTPTNEHILIEEDSTGSNWYKPASWILDDEALAFARNPKRKER